MVTTNGILPPGLENLALKTETKKPEGELGQSQFLQLMLTQIQHQDPLNPLESGEFLSQLAQFGTVNGITELKSSFDNFAASMQSSQALQASTLVGRSVLIEGNTKTLATAETIEGAVELVEATAGLSITISDAVGQVVQQLNLGENSAGLVPFTWDGLDSSGNAVAPGTYQVTAQASINNQVVAQPTLLQAKVESVTLAGGIEGPILNLQGLDPVSINNVKQIL